VAVRQGLAKTGQLDFSAGMFRGVARHLIPDTGFYEGQNVLLDDDGSAYERGGSEYLSTAAFGSSLRFLWEGVLAAGRRTVLATPSEFGVLAADGTVVSLGGAGLAAPLRGTVVGGVLFIDDGTMYAGSRMTADYSTGTVAVTQGSTTVVGTGTAWGASVDAGMLLRLGSNRYYAVKSVTDDTHLEIGDAYEGATASGQAYTLTRLGIASAPYVAGQGYAAIFNRLLVFDGSELRFSAGRDETGLIRTHVFNADDRHTFDGVDIIGADALRDIALVFTTGGVFAITGMAYDLLDPSGVNFQQQVELVNRDLILWGKEGIATYQNQLVVPCVDGVWTISPAATPQLLTRSIFAMYRDYVRQGYRPGLAAVHRSHYLLPIIDATNTVVDTLVCRLDRPTDTRLGRTYPWTHWTGHAGSCPALVSRVGDSTDVARQPDLVAAGPGGRVVRLSGCWEPAGWRKHDADGTDFTFVLVTRDMPTGDGNLNHVRRLRVRYELEKPPTYSGTVATWDDVRWDEFSWGEETDAADAAQSDPQMRAYYSLGLAQAASSWDEVNWDEFQWADPVDTEWVPLPGGAPPDLGRNPMPWHFAARGRYIRARLECSDPVARLVVREVVWFVRPSAKDR
jgi:hypothetical protein